MAWKFLRENNIWIQLRFVWHTARSIEPLPSAIFNSIMAAEGDNLTSRPSRGQRTPEKQIPTKRKQATTESANGDGDDSEESPTKKPKVTTKKGSANKKVKPKQALGDDEELRFSGSLKVQERRRLCSWHRN